MEKKTKEPITPSTLLGLIVCPPLFIRYVFKPIHSDLTKLFAVIWLCLYLTAGVIVGKIIQIEYIWPYQAQQARYEERAKQFDEYFHKKYNLEIQKEK